MSRATFWQRRWGKRGAGVDPGLHGDGVVDEDVDLVAQLSDLVALGLDLGLQLLDDEPLPAELLLVPLDLVGALRVGSLEVHDALRECLVGAGLLGVACGAAGPPGTDDDGEQGDEDAEHADPGGAVHRGSPLRCARTSRRRS